MVNIGCGWLIVGELEKIGVALGFGARVRRLAVMLFVYGPAAVFYHSIYSEAIYTYLTFKLTTITLTQNLKKTP